jgi:hypothetical protein
MLLMCDGKKYGIGAEPVMPVSGFQRRRQGSGLEAF